MASFLLPSSFALLFLLSAASASPAANPSPSTDEVPAGGMARVMKEARNDFVWGNPPPLEEMSQLVVLAVNYKYTEQYWRRDGINEKMPSAPLAFGKLESVQVKKGEGGEINYDFGIGVTLTGTGLPANSRKRLLHGHVRRVGDSPPALVGWYFDNSGVPQGHH